MTNMDPIIHQDCSTLSKYLKYWENGVANYLPNTLAPNIITFSGGVVMLLSGLLAMISQEPWTFLFHSLVIFILQTCDALNKIQVLRLGVLSGLGNYINHATDIITVQIMFQVFFQTLGSDRGFLIFATLFVNYNIYLTHWGIAQTGILYFPDGFSITELRWLCIIIHLITYFFPAIWSFELLGLSLGNVFIMGIISVNFYFLTIPLIRRVLDKKNILVLKSLMSLSAVTLVLALWSFTTNIESIYLICYLNIPYSLMIGQLLLSYLGLGENDKIQNNVIENEENDEDIAGNLDFRTVYVLLYAIFQLEFIILYGDLLIKSSVLLFIYVIIGHYFNNITRISRDLDIPIFSLQKNIKKDE